MIDTLNAQCFVAKYENTSVAISKIYVNCSKAHAFDNIVIIIIVNFYVELGTKLNTCAIDVREMHQWISWTRA